MSDSSVYSSDNSTLSLYTMCSNGSSGMNSTPDQLVTSLPSSSASSGWASAAIWNENLNKHISQASAWPSSFNKPETPKLGGSILFQEIIMKSSTAMNSNGVIQPPRDATSSRIFSLEGKNGNNIKKISTPSSGFKSLHSTIKWTYDTKEDIKIWYNGRNILDLASNVKPAGTCPFRR